VISEIELVFCRVDKGSLPHFETNYKLFFNLFSIFCNFFVTH
jgi:hypothetical protein